MSSVMHDAPLLSAEQYAAMPAEQTRHTELVDGEIQRMSPASFGHGGVAATIIGRLFAFVEPGVGVVLSSETGFTISRDPDTVRAPDAAFVRADRVPPHDEQDGFAELAPDLVVEVVSPHDRASEVTSKALAWVDAGVRLVWVIDPGTRTVTVLSPDGVARLVRGADAALDGADVLPGFRLPLDHIFA